LGAGYRVRQFWKALTARVTPAEEALVAEILPAAGQELFRSLPRQDQRHGIDVLRAVVDAGETDRDAWAAALLHDCGKAGSGLTIFHRVAVVLLKAFRPGWLDRLVREKGAAWDRPFRVQGQHPEIGATLAQEAGCSELTVWLIRHHQAPGAAGEGHQQSCLEALQRADGAS
jgi:hypothetical protein